MKYKRTAGKRSYSIEILPERVLLVSEFDKKHTTYKQRLTELLDSVEGLDDTDCGADYGPYIYVNIDCADDTPQTWEKIEKILDTYTVERGILTPHSPT